MDFEIRVLFSKQLLDTELAQLRPTEGVNFSLGIKHKSVSFTAGSLLNVVLQKPVDFDWRKGDKTRLALNRVPLKVLLVDAELPAISTPPGKEFSTLRYHCVVIRAAFSACDKLGF